MDDSERTSGRIASRHGKYKLVMNLAIAKAFGLPIPPGRSDPHSAKWRRRRDIIPSKHGVGAIRIYDQINAYAPDGSRARSGMALTATHAARCTVLQWRLASGSSPGE